MASSNILLVLGAGPNVGIHTIKYFSLKGFKTCAVSRNPSDEVTAAADLVLKRDFSDPKGIASVFSELKSKLGIPNVVVYNSYTTKLDPDPAHVPLEDFIKGFNINLISAYAAVQETIRGFRELPSQALKTFIYTGNASAHVAIPIVMDLGMAKSAATHMVDCLVKAYGDEGFRFYFADERAENGQPISMKIGGQVHAETYYELAVGKEQVAWEYTFVKGLGYVNFQGKEQEIVWMDRKYIQKG